VAEAAGIRPGDRIQRLGGRGFADPDEFRERVASEPGALRLEVETDGRVRTVEIPPADEASLANRDDAKSSD
jgi:S1-C subfamily serine protease